MAEEERNEEHESSGGNDDVPGGASVPASGADDWDPPAQNEDESKFSKVDAMGQDKYRKIIGEGYGPGRTRQLIYYGAFLGFLALLYFGGKIAVDELDKAPAKDADKAPWSGNTIPPRQFE